MLEINLLPKEYRRRGNVFNFDKKLVYIGVAAAAFVIVLGGITFYQNHQMGRLQKLIAKARIEEGRYKNDIAIIDALTEVKEKILARVSAIEKLDQRRDFYIKLMEDLNTRIPEFLWMTGFAETPPSTGTPVNQPGTPGKPANVAKGQVAANQPPAQPVNPAIGQAVIEGYAHSLNAVGSFIIGLMKSEFFDNVKLSQAINEDVGSVTAYNFKITCDLNYDADLARDEFEDMSDEDFDFSSASAEDEDYSFDYFNDNYEEQ
ncbi:MAG: PilN domain-containing protein [Candidatus Zixiibacteriota bacterium]